MSASGTTGSTTNNPQSTVATVNADTKFLRFLLSDLFNDGTHIWWLIGLCCVITLAAVVFSFFGAIIDSDFLFDSHVARKVQHLQEEEEDTTRHSMILMRSKRELNYPYLPIELDSDYANYISKRVAPIDRCGSKLCDEPDYVPLFTPEKYYTNPTTDTNTGSEARTERKTKQPNVKPNAISNAWTTGAVGTTGMQNLARTAGQRNRRR